MGRAVQTTGESGGLVIRGRLFTQPCGMMVQGVAGAARDMLFSGSHGASGKGMNIHAATVQEAGKKRQAQSKGGT